MQVVKSICKNVAVMDSGKIIEAGPVSEVFIQRPLFLKISLKAQQTLVSPLSESSSGLTIGAKSDTCFT
ncbi:hypothetical protein FC25_GL002023 [Ligilactobacillus ruminis DSM 20403 = NBRC 102161]|uniref:ABC transporter ATP-binding protein n=1 Tax=Ligilactobacillus ruminis TaxID=1623 RepID=A0A837IPW3_9LACO|nr:hypothetical protein LRB_1201 [Ligilactobacillus ruminis]KRM83108.1 hypothetical protein FC25_GL002023 [Ligilactobacillus ruminis DSM 20403 = NBRC 102161]